MLVVLYINQGPSLKGGCAMQLDEPPVDKDLDRSKFEQQRVQVGVYLVTVMSSNVQYIIIDFETALFRVRESDDLML